VSDPQRPCFAALYDFSLNAAKKAVHLHNIEGLNELDEASSRNKGRAQILFLNGHPSPQWLNAIGGRFCVDPEFYQRHLDFRAAISRPDYFTLPALPSASETMARLRITTIGYRQPRLGFSAHQHPQRYLDRLRSEAAKGMTQYENTLRMEDKWKTGDSIIRDFAIHDTEHFTIEQDISICIDRIGHGWICKWPFDSTKKTTDKIISSGMARCRGYPRGQSPWSMDISQETQRRPDRVSPDNTTKDQNSS
jgi:hypothetical protein